MSQTQDMTLHPVTVYRHRADLLCYPLMWNVTLECKTTYFNVLGKAGPGNPSLTFHTNKQMLNFMYHCYKYMQAMSRYDLRCLNTNKQTQATLYILNHNWVYLDGDIRAAEVVGGVLERSPPQVHQRLVLKDQDFMVYF